MLRAALRTPAARSFAYQSARGLASKPPPKPPRAAPPPPPPSAAQAASKPAGGAGPADAPVTPIEKLSVPSLDFTPGEEPQQERTGARSSKDSLSSIERRRRFLGRVSAALLLAGAGAATWLMGREWEDEELQAKRMVRARLFLGPCGRVGGVLTSSSSLFLV